MWSGCGHCSVVRKKQPPTDDNVFEVWLSYSPWAHTKLNSHITPTLWQRHIHTIRPFGLRDTTHTHTQTEAHARTDTHNPLARETLPTHTGRCRLSHSKVQTGGFELPGSCEITKQLPGVHTNIHINMLPKSHMKLDKELPSGPVLHETFYMESVPAELHWKICRFPQNWQDWSSSQALYLLCLLNSLIIFFTHNSVVHLHSKHSSTFIINFTDSSPKIIVENV